jgi:FAD/FMN-containing dehydrogenase
MADFGELNAIVGSDHVLKDSGNLEAFSGDLSFVPKVRPGCVVRPENTGQVKKIVEWANETLTPLVPVSSGPPHFRGDTVPSLGGTVIVDLSRMKRILRIDPLNRVAMVEPGVTFAELQAELNKVGLCAYTPLHPRRSKSVIGSMLEREPITMPAHHWDATDPMLCAEIIFGTGDVLRGGEAAGPDTIEEQWEIGKAQMTPMGLSQFNEHRLISGAQGTIGIVTWSTLKCRLMSKLNRTLFIPSEYVEPLIDLSYRLMRIRLGDHCFILNDLNLACLLTGTTHEINTLKADLLPWALIVSFEGYGELPEEKMEYQEADFRDMARSYHLEPLDTISGIKTDVLSVLLALPSDEPYWKLKYKGGCHDIFFLTTFDKAPSFVSATTTLAGANHFPPEDIGVYIQPIVQGTSCHMEFNLHTDPSTKDELARTKRLVSEGSRDLAKRGGFFSRPYGAWVDFAYGGASETVMMQRKVKKIFDPNDILNPAKLCL